MVNWWKSVTSFVFMQLVLTTQHVEHVAGICPVTCPESPSEFGLLHLLTGHLVLVLPQFYATL